MFDLLGVLFSLALELLLRLVAAIFEVIGYLVELTVPDSKRSKVDRW